MKKLLCDTCRERIVREIDVKGSGKNTHHITKSLHRLRKNIDELNYLFDLHL